MASHISHKLGGCGWSLLKRAIEFGTRPSISFTRLSTTVSFGPVLCQCRSQPLPGTVECTQRRTVIMDEFNSQSVKSLQITHQRDLTDAKGHGRFGLR